MSATTSPQSETTRPTLAKRFAFALLAILTGLIPFVIVECICRFGGIGSSTPSTDPYLEFANVRPLFERASSGDRYQVPESRQVYFCPEAFPARKEDNEFRIFCLGGSTVQGRPYAIDTAFPAWLELSLTAADPSRKWEVVNCGGVSYASYRLIPILEEVINYQPDLIIVLTGHNEFLEDRTYREVKEAPPWLTKTHRLFSQLNTYNALRSYWMSGSEKPHKSVLPEEVTARLDERGALKEYVRDTKWKRGVIHHFGMNLERMSMIARRAGVPLYFVEPVSNLRNCPPFKYQATDGLTPAQRSQVDALWSIAKRDETSMDVRIAKLQEALGIDPENAGLLYHLGKSYEAAGLSDEARTWLIKAKDEDVCPLRVLEPMKVKMRRVANSYGNRLVDLRDLFESRSEMQLPGRETFVDHVHPTIKLHKLIANRLTETLESDGIIKLDAGWSERREQSYIEHYGTLDPLYFERARERLHGLKLWAAGRAGTLFDNEPSSKR